MSHARVLSIVPYKILPAKLGGEKGIALFNEYVGKEVELIAIGTKDNDLSAVSNYSFLKKLPTSRSRYLNVLLYFFFRKMLRRQKATHLLIEHPYFGWLAWLLKKTTRIIWVVHSHNIEFERSKSIGRWWWPVLKWYEKWVYRNADFIFFISEDDRAFAAEHLSVRKSKSAAITYGVEINERPTDTSTAREIVKSRHGIDNSEYILLFNGALYHHTNYDALRVILDYINPLLLKSHLAYKIIVCGKGLPDSFNELKEYASRNIIYAGFVDDISIYFKAADIFLNPIMAGAGVKTKAIEAAAYNCTVISTEFGALGLNRDAFGKKLCVIRDNAWEEFASKIIVLAQARYETESSFYQYYYWGNIAKKVADILNEKAPV